jgi:hypothetical protein
MVWPPAELAEFRLSEHGTWSDKALAASTDGFYSRNYTGMLAFVQAKDSRRWESLSSCRSHSGRRQLYGGPSVHELSEHRGSVVMPLVSHLSHPPVFDTVEGNATPALSVAPEPQ